MAPSGKFWMAMPTDSAIASAAAMAGAPASPARTAAHTTPTAIPSGMLCRVTASSIMVMRGSRAGGPSGRAARWCRWGMRRSSKSRNSTPSQKPPAAGPKAQAPSPAASACSMAGMSRLQTEAAVITPAAKPASTRCTPCPSCRRMNKTHPAPSAVPTNGSASPHAARSFIA